MGEDDVGLQFAVEVHQFLHQLGGFVERVVAGVEERPRPPSAFAAASPSARRTAFTSSKDFPARQRLADSPRSPKLKQAMARATHPARSMPRRPRPAREVARMSGDCEAGSSTLSQGASLIPGAHETVPRFNIRDIHRYCQHTNHSGLPLIHAFSNMAFNSAALVTGRRRTGPRTRRRRASRPPRRVRPAAVRCSIPFGRAATMTVPDAAGRMPCAPVPAWPVRGCLTMATSRGGAESDSI